MLQPRLVHVSALEGQRLSLVYEDGAKRIFDVTPYIRGDWYGELRDETYFGLVRLLPDGSGIEWPHGQDIAPHELFDLSEEACS